MEAAVADRVRPFISVDDHVVEPPWLWTDRLPSKHRDLGPRVVRAPVEKITYRGGSLTPVMGHGDGPVADWWVYEDLRRPLMRTDAAVGFARDDVGTIGITYEEMRPGAFERDARLGDMDLNGVGASLCFPTLPRFCGQTFTEAKDHQLAMLCIKAYNDWMVEEWCGPSNGRLIPLIIVPLWDPELAAAEVRRNAASGVRAVAFSELPPYLGLPSVHTKHWDPLFQACEETNSVLHMHIGSSSQMPSTSPDAPPAVGSILTFNNACLSLVDWLMSGVFTRFPTLEIAYSEGQVGWIPYVLQRADLVWRENRGWGEVADFVLEPPSEVFRQHVYGCVFNDVHGLASLDTIGRDRVAFEVDYPHSDSTWPNSVEIIAEQVATLDEEVTEMVLRSNATRLLRMED